MWDDGELRRCGGGRDRSPKAAGAGPASDMDHVAKRDIDLMVRLGCGRLRVMAW